MLSPLKYALQHSARRALSTAAVSEVQTIPDLPQQLSHSLTQSLSFGLRAHEVDPTPSPSLVQPVYLTMSSLIRPEQEGSTSEDVVELDPFIFDHPIRRDILHLCVVQHLDSLRQGSASTKTRGEVRGSGRKIRPQKGTGMARLGDGQSPMLRGGGIAFGPKPRDFATKLPRKVIQMGMRVALSAKVKERGFGVVHDLQWPDMKTKGLAERLEELGWKKTLFVTGNDTVPEGLRRASSNLYKIETTTAEKLTIYDVVKWPRLVVDVQAVEWFEKSLAKPAPPPKVL